MPTYDDVNLERREYGVVLNDIAEEFIATDINLAGWILGKATLDEALSCSKILQEYGSLNFLSQPKQEMAISPSGNGFQFVPLNDISKWRYVVVRPTAAAEIDRELLAEALRISDADLCVEIWCKRKSHDSEVIQSHPAQCVQYLARASREELSQTLEVNHLIEVVNLRARFDNDKFRSIVKAIEMFRALDVNPPSAVKMLGYFGVIESLLSHAPLPSDSADSISRQLKRNLILINNRMDSNRSLGFNEFGNTKAEVVISKLYAYRSAIAHGGDESVKLKKLTDLHQGWPENALDLWPDRFLRRLVKRVLVHALREPQLVIDLKG